MNLTPRSFVRDAAALAVAAILLSGVAFAQDVAQQVSPAVPPAAAPAASPPPLAAEAPVAIETQPQDQLRAQVQALVAGTLDVAVTPQSLFEVLLSDEGAVQIETLRLRALLQALDDAARPKRRSAATAPPKVGSLRDEVEGLDPARWASILELDRTRLEFYALSQERRTEILQGHAARQEAARPRESEEERRARETEVEHQRALEAARQARTEAERIVGEELARLIALEGRVDSALNGFREARQEIAARRDTVLGWQRKARDAKTGDTTQADITYDALRRTLRASRNDLAVALSALGSDKSSVPTLGPDALVDIPSDIPTEVVRERRSAVERAILDARLAESALREERASAWIDEIDALNRDRLGLLLSLSAAKRGSITGFTATGWDQARSEARHLSLILRYHHHVVLRWLGTLRSTGPGAVSPWRAAGLALPLFLALIAIFWGTRRTHALLTFADGRIAAADEVRSRTSPSLGLRFVRILLKTHKQVEWILFFVVTSWLLPKGARNLLEVQLLSSAIGWTLAAALIVNVINAFAAGSTAPSLVPREEAETGHLRLKSLRLVGWVVLVFALILMLSARLVGEGTIYRWVFSTCWFAAVPVFLLLVRWWRGTVFVRLDRIRKKTPLQAWILANRSGWKSFAASMLGALQLFASGAIKVVSGWLANFDLARRIHAYLFQRELERLSEGRNRTVLLPLPVQALEALHPEGTFQRWLPCPSDKLRDALVQRAALRVGGLVAVVAARGMGKSSLLRSILDQVGAAVVVDCNAETSLSDLKTAMCISGEGSSSKTPAVVLVDEAHTLVQPRIGGLAKFDEIIAFARGHSEGTTWVFAIDASLWPLLKRARDARPVFDETHVLSRWNEAQLGALLAQRCMSAGLTPHYDDLLDKLPPGADDIDLQDAIRAKRAGYERMLWDHVGGNPGLALQTWRVSLGLDEADVVHVRPLQVLDTSILEKLPDSSLFILRTVLQLSPTGVATVALATRLHPDQVLQEFRFGMSRGFYDDKSGLISIAWPWLRAVSGLLERRHLLVNP